MEIVPGLHVIPLPYGSVYLIDGESITLVDSGFRAAGGKVLRYIERMGRKPVDVGLILLTHCHVDHSGAAAWLRKRTGARVLCHPGEAQQQKDGTYRISPNAGESPVFRLMNAISGNRSFVLDGVLSDGQVLPVAGGLRIISTPGHSADHVCLYLERSKALFAGDLIINNGNRICRPFPFRGMSSELVQSSLEKLAALEVNALCPAHGKPLTGDVTPLLRRFIESPPVSFSTWKVVKHLAVAPFRSRKKD